jgi:hypothetical protein
VDAAPEVSGVGWKEKQDEVVVEILCKSLNLALVCLFLPPQPSGSDPHETRGISCVINQIAESSTESIALLLFEV